MFASFNHFIAFLLLAVVIAGVFIGVKNGTENIGQSITSDVSIAMASAADPSK